MIISRILLYVVPILVLVLLLDGNCRAAAYDAAIIAASGSRIYRLRAGACCNTALITAASHQVSCSSVGFRAPPPVPPSLYDGCGGGSVFQQLARCGMARPAGPPPPPPPAGAIGAPGRPPPTHQLAHDLLTLQRLYSPPSQSAAAAAEHFKPPPFFPGESPLLLTVTRLSTGEYFDTRGHVACTGMCSYSCSPF